MAASKKPKLQVDVDVEDTAEEQEVAAAVEDVLQVQMQIEQLNDEASDKVLKIEEEYNKLRKPIYARRAEAIAKIPDFWYQCFMQHPFLCNQMSPEDSEIFTFLRQVTVEEFADIKSGFRINFTFAENPYFSNKQLSKSFHFESADGPVSCSAPAIHWLPGKDPNQSTDEPMGKRAREAESFFHWFPREHEPYDTGQDSIADAIKDQLWLNPLKYYSGDIEDWEQEEEWQQEGDGEEGAADDDVAWKEEYDLTGEEEEGYEEQESAEGEGGEEGEDYGDAEDQADYDEAEEYEEGGEEGEEYEGDEGEEEEPPDGEGDEEGEEAEEYAEGDEEEPGDDAPD